MDFPDPGVQSTVVHPVSGARFLLLPCPQLYFSDKRITELVRICNSPDILDMIRKGGIPVGARYTRKHATSFLKYCLEGWEENDHYVFFLVTDDAEQRLAGCYELRNEKKHTFETGYWIAPAFRGIGRTGLMALLDNCRLWKVQSIHARAMEHNLASRRLLEKSGFRPIHRGREKTVNGVILTYEIVLSGRRSEKKKRAEKSNCRRSQPATARIARKSGNS